MKDIDKGYKDVIKKLQMLQSKTLQAGIFSDAGVNEKTGTLIADYAHYNEFGTKHIPARSFIGSTCDEQSKKWEAMKDEIVDKIIDDPSSNVGRLIGLLGEQVVADIKEKITSDISPENRPSTIYRKTKGKGGKTTTLIDTGNMRDAIKYKIVDK